MSLRSVRSAVGSTREVNLKKPRSSGDENTCKGNVTSGFESLTESVLKGKGDMQEMPRQTEFAPIKLVVEKTQWKADTQQKKNLIFRIRC